MPASHPARPTRFGLTSIVALSLVFVAAAHDIGRAESRLGQGDGGQLVNSPGISFRTETNSAPADTALWESYINARFGTAIDYPTADFTALAPPENNDGHSFESRDGGIQIRVWAGHNALFESLNDRLTSLTGDSGIAPIFTLERIGGSGFRLVGLRKGALVLHAALFGPDNIIHNLEITLKDPTDAAAQARMQAVLASLRMAPAEAFGPAAARSVHGQQVAIHTPARGTPERVALMDAARAVITPELGQPVIFLPGTLYSQGDWAFLSAEPLRPDGTPLDWFQTPFAEAWRNDAMSTEIMVLMHNNGSGWHAVDHVIGPTDVYWLNWVEAYQLPYALFFQN